MFALAHNDYKSGLGRYSFFKLNNQTMSDDLVQDTFIKAWSYVVKGGKIETMKAFLYHILNNLVIDQYRKEKNSSLDTLLEAGFEPSFDNTETVFNSLDGERALKLIDELPPKYKRAVELRYKQGLSLKEISEITGESKNTVAVQIHRGLEKLRALYKD